MRPARTVTAKVGSTGDAVVLAEMAVRHALHDMASPLAALRLELELAALPAETGGRIAAIADQLERRLQHLRCLAGGERLTPDLFAAGLADAMAPREVAIDIEEGASALAMRVVLMLAPLLAGELGGRAPVQVRLGRNGFEIRLPDVRVAPGEALRRALRGEAPTQSGHAFATLAAHLSGPVACAVEGGAVRIFVNGPS